MAEMNNNETYQPMTFDAMDCSVSVSSDPARTGSVTVGNIRRFATKVSSAIAVEWKLPKQAFAVSVWGTLSWLLLSLISGILKEFLPAWD